MDLITEAMGKMLSRKVVLIFDACHSGGAKVALNKGTEEQESSLEYLEKVAAGTGRFLFTSSAGDEYSRESPELGHGIFTYVLLEALRGSNADFIKDGQITLSEMNTYIQGNFPRAAKKFLGTNMQSPPCVLSVGRDSANARENDFPFVPAE